MKIDIVIETHEEFTEMLERCHSYADKSGIPFFTFIKNGDGGYSLHPSVRPIKLFPFMSQDVFDAIRESFPTVFAEESKP